MAQVHMTEATQQEPLTISGLIELAAERERLRGYKVTLDEGHALDVEQIVNERKPWSPRSWE
jgi:hypothetical protein